MPTAPDWLLQMSKDADNLVDDSPQFRQAEQTQQKGNLISASKSALEQVHGNTVDAQREAAVAGLQSLKSGQEQIAAMTPTPTPTFSTPLFNEGVPTEQAPPSEFSASPAVVPPPSFEEAPIEEPVTAAPNSLGGEEPDLIGTITRISEASGLSPQIVATMALLGKDIAQMEQDGTAEYEQSPQTPPPAPPPSPAVAPAPPIAPQGQTPDFRAAAPSTPVLPPPQPPSPLNTPQFMG